MSSLWPQRGQGIPGGVSCANPGGRRRQRWRGGSGGQEQGLRELDTTHQRGCPHKLDTVWMGTCPWLLAASTVHQKQGTKRCTLPPSEGDNEMARKISRAQKCIRKRQDRAGRGIYSYCTAFVQSHAPSTLPKRKSYTAWRLVCLCFWRQPALWGHHPSAQKPEAGLGGALVGGSRPLPIHRHLGPHRVKR